MNRPRRGLIMQTPKQFVSGGIYEPFSNNKSPGAQQDQQQQNEQQHEHQQQKDDKSIIEELIVTTDEAAASATSTSVLLSSEENRKLMFKKIFITRKKSAVRAKEKKIRQNRQLRKAILPKNALMALNEVKGITISDFNVNSNVDGGFTAIVTVNEKQFEGKGTSKASAKNNACEKALRDYILQKMKQRPRIAPKTNVPVTPSETMDQEESDGADSQKETEEYDDMPMLNLASFAIYKLYTEWEREGFVIPELHPALINQPINPNENGTIAPKEPKEPSVRTELPPMWETMHPSTLLCLMRPGLTYTEYGTVGEKPNVLQRMGVIVDGREFVATGRSKKIARRNTATQVCNEIFNTNFAVEG